MKVMDFYLIQAISNLHVGSGEGDFSIVDKQIQRDPVCNLPTIHASGIKGALREAMEQEAKTDTALAPTIIEIFGSDPKDRDKKIKQGLNHFFEGKLLVLPIRSSHDFFYRATCPLVLEEFASILKQFDKTHAALERLELLSELPVAKGQPLYFGTENGEIMLEDWKAKHDHFEAEALTPILGERPALLHNDDFKALAKEMPIIARNYLNEGISENLWYEEVAPRESRFYTMVSRHQENDGLDSYLQKRKNLVQLGANATVGYGLCNFKKI